MGVVVVTRTLLDRLARAAHPRDRAGVWADLSCARRLPDDGPGIRRLLRDCALDAMPPPPGGPHYGKRLELARTAAYALGHVHALTRGMPAAPEVTRVLADVGSTWLAWWAQGGDEAEALHALGLLWGWQHA